MSIKTVFLIKDDISKSPITVLGFGQDAANAIHNKVPYPNSKKIIRGFIINDKFVPIDLTSHWERTITSKK